MAGSDYGRDDVFIPLTDPGLTNPIMIAGWCGMGPLEFYAVNYIREKLGAEEFGEFDPYAFFPRKAVHVEDGVIGDVCMPEFKFYSCKPKGEELVIFAANVTLDDDNTEALCSAIAGEARELGVRRIYTFSTLPVQKSCNQEMGVFGLATTEELKYEMKASGMKPLACKRSDDPAVVLLSIAKEEADIDGICIIGERPAKLGLPYLRTAHKMLKAFALITEIDIDLDEVQMKAKEMEKALKARCPADMKQYIGDLKTMDTGNLPEGVKSEIENLFMDAENATPRQAADKIEQLKLRLGEFDLFGAPEYRNRFNKLLGKK